MSVDYFCANCVGHSKLGLVKIEIVNYEYVYIWKCPSCKKQIKEIMDISDTVFGLLQQIDMYFQSCKLNNKKMDTDYPLWERVHKEICRITY